MTDDETRAVRRRQLRLSPVWFVPILAVVIGGWMAYQRFVSSGPTVVLRMAEAEGIEADKTLIKARNVEVGRVVDVRLSDDVGHVLVEARLRAGSERMLNEGTDFWVVKPRIGTEGISGLNTVLSGAYIALRPGDGSQPKRRFEVLDSPPVTGSGDEGLRIRLVSEPEHSLREGAPVNYHGTTVGRVTAVRYDADTRRVIHEVLIRPTHTDLVRSKTRFWTASGVSVRYLADGFTARFESLETLLSGGVSLDLPEEGDAGEPVSGDHRFQVHPSRAAATDALYGEAIEYVILVEDSVTGLKPGAAVRYRGIQVGTVANVGWRFDALLDEDGSARAVPVLVRIEPARLTGRGEELDLAAWKERMEQLVNAGMRASIQRHNLITGSSYVSLGVRAEPGAVARSEHAGHPVLPMSAGGVGRLQDQVGDLLDKLNGLDIESVLASLEDSAASSRDTFQSVERTSDTLNALIKDPAAERLPAELEATLGKLRTTLAGFEEQSPVYRQLEATLGRIEAVMKAAEPLVRTLRDRPNALIFDKRERKDPEPEAPRR